MRAVYAPLTRMGVVNSVRRNMLVFTLRTCRRVTLLYTETDSALEPKATNDAVLGNHMTSPHSPYAYPRRSRLALARFTARRHNLKPVPHLLFAPEYSIHRRFGARGIEERNFIWSSCVALHLDAFDPKFLSASLVTEVISQRWSAASSIVKEKDGNRRTEIRASSMRTAHPGRYTRCVTKVATGYVVITLSGPRPYGSTW